MLLLLVLIGQVTWAQSKKQQIATLSATLDSLKAEQSSLQSKVETLNANIEQLTNEKRLLNYEKSILQKKLSDSSIVCEKQRKSITILTREKNDLERKLNESERKREEVAKNGILRMEPDMMSKLSVDNYESMYEIQVNDCIGWIFSMDGRYRFYNYEDCMYGVMVALDNNGQEKVDDKYIVTFSFNGGISSGINQFGYYDSGTLVIFNAGQGDPSLEMPPSLFINDQECEMRMTRRVELNLE